MRDATPPTDPLFIGLAECTLDGCDNEVQGFFSQACCERHERALREWAAECMQSDMNLKEWPDKPTAEVVDKRAERAKRWNPERMKERINELRVDA